jgi:hypothetical protein
MRWRGSGSFGDVCLQFVYTQCAEHLGVSRPTLYRLLAERTGG